MTAFDSQALEQKEALDNLNLTKATLERINKLFEAKTQLGTYMDAESMKIMADNAETDREVRERIRRF